MLTPVGIAMLFRAFPPIERARAATIVMVPTLAAPALGPVLGGLITDTIGWRWIFFVNVPIGLAALVFGLRFLREHTEPGAGRFDIPGFVLSAFGLAAIIYALNEGPRVGLGRPGRRGARHRRRDRLRGSSYGSRPTARNRCSPCVCCATACSPPPTSSWRSGWRASSACCSSCPLYLQGLRGLDPFESGLVTFPQAIGILISSQVAGRIYGRVGPRRLVVGGMFGAAVSVAAFTQLGMETDLWIVRVLLFARGLAMGFTFVAVQTASYARIAPSDNGRASAIFSTQRQMSVSIGVALMATVLSGFTPLASAPADPQRALDGLPLDVRGLHRCWR